MDGRLAGQGEIFFTETCSDLRTLNEIGSLITEAPDPLITARLAVKPSASFSDVIIVVVWDWDLLHSPGWLQTSHNPPASVSFVSMFCSIGVSCKLPCP